MGKNFSEKARFRDYQPFAPGSKENILFRTKSEIGQFP